MLICHVVGARPNFMKAAPLLRSLAHFENVKQLLVHTGQHYDANMSDVFFQQLGIPEPDINLQVGSGSHAQQTAQIMVRFEGVIEEYGPGLVVVYGDVNSTVAATLVCSKLGVRVAHVEAGLRSFDRSMPEEINRIITDHLANLLFVPSEDGVANLLHEGIPTSKIHLVGNVMIDTLQRMLPEAVKRIPEELPDKFLLVTLHRPSNVDDPLWLKSLLGALQSLSVSTPVLFPVHPRTRKRLEDAGLIVSGLQFLDPMPYLEFLGLQTRATAVITDSGGIQEETSFLGVPCFTMRENTERPVTITLGTNMLVGRDLRALCQGLDEVLSGKRKPGHVPELWDGFAASRIASAIIADMQEMQADSGRDAPTAAQVSSVE
jgi:UDP-N-acetylglucosamine 2-epimerase (non-hydrolysing)